jgi:tRNA-binding protein
MNTIEWSDFEKVHLCVGTIIKVEPFPEARKPAYKLWVNLGDDIGVKKSSAQITENYTLENLINQQVVCVVNFSPRQIGPFMSEILVTGFPDDRGNILLTTVDQKVANGSRLF